MKYAQDFTETRLVMTDNKGNKAQFEYVGAIAEGDAVAALQVEMRQRGDVTAAALSLMVQILDNPRFAAYAGKIEMGHKMDPKLKTAIREEEEKHLKPLFYAQWDKKNKKADEKERAGAWDTFIGNLRTGGIYGNVKSYSTQYLGYFGKLPCVYDADGHPDKKRLLAVSAMAKLIANAKTDLPTVADAGIVGAIKKLAGELRDRTEKTKVADATDPNAYAGAIASLKEMLATFEGLQREAAERATNAVTGAAHEDVSKMAQAATRKASAPRRVKKEEAALM